MSVIQDILAARPKPPSGAPAFMVPPLTGHELDGIEQWIRDQLQAQKPDSLEWTLLWCGEPPLFGGLISVLLQGHETRNIMDCCEPLADPTQLEHWNDLDHGQQFVLQRWDRTRFFIYDAPLAIFIDRTDPQDAWRLGDGVDADLWRRPTSADVLNALLFTWRHRFPKGKRARERLCDIADKTLAKVRSRP